MNVEESVRKAQRGDASAFYQLVQQHKEQLYKTAYVYARNREDALDIVQEAVCKAFASVHRLRNPEFFSTWLIRILINCAIRHCQKQKKERQVLQMVSDSANPHPSGLAEDLLDVYQAIERLAPKYQEIILLKYVHDLTIEHIATVLQRPTGTVKTHLHKALEMLRKHLQGGVDHGTNLTSSSASVGSH